MGLNIKLQSVNRRNNMDDSNQIIVEIISYLTKIHENGNIIMNVDMNVEIDTNPDLISNEMLS